MGNSNSKNNEVSSGDDDYGTELEYNSETDDITEYEKIINSLENIIKEVYKENRFKISLKVLKKIVKDKPSPHTKKVDIYRQFFVTSFKDFVNDKKSLESLPVKNFLKPILMEYYKNIDLNTLSSKRKIFSYLLSI